MKLNKELVRFLPVAVPVILLLVVSLWNQGEESKNGSVKEEKSEYLKTAGEADYVEGQLFFEEEKSPPATVYVHIGGRVKNPGVYEVPSDARAVDVLLLAGGFLEDASMDEVNMAAPVLDGMQIIIPSIFSEREGESKINLNSASKETLMSLPGIGDSKAEAILSYRKKHGRFQTVEEVKKVEGIKDGVYDKIKEYIVAN